MPWRVFADRGGDVDVDVGELAREERSKTGVVGRAGSGWNESREAL